ncbi:hypothetical protein EAF00_007288 [Botryotinia globosa]|nr:hypothetical protein EAF00_007288 [Botryotinia globosa]
MQQALHKKDQDEMVKVDIRQEKGRRREGRRDCEEQINGRITKIQGGTLMIEMLVQDMEWLVRKEKNKLQSGKGFVSRKKEIRNQNGGGCGSI